MGRKEKRIGRGIAFLRRWRPQGQEGGQERPSLKWLSKNDRKEMSLASADVLEED